MAFHVLKSESNGKALARRYMAMSGAGIPATSVCLAFVAAVLLPSASASESLTLDPERSSTVLSAGVYNAGKYNTSASDGNASAGRALLGHESTLFETTSNRNASLSQGLYQLCHSYLYDCDCKTYACHCYTSDCNCYDYDCHCQYQWGVKISCERCRSCATCQTCQSCTSCYGKCTGEACTVFECPANSESGTAPRNDEITDCTCIAGTTGPDGGPCTSCAAGKYKDTRGSDKCRSCLAGKHVQSTGSASPSACLWCAAGKYSDEGAPSCTDCPSGKYSTTSVGNNAIESCLPCARGTYAPEAGTTECSECVAGKFSDSLGASNMSACRDCAPGKYVSTIGSGSADDCAACGAGKHSKTSGATSINTCIDCPKGTHSMSSATFCDCDAGYARSSTCNDTASACASHASVHGECVACRAGTFRAEPTGANASSCEPCPVGTYSNLAAPVCSNCTAQPGNYCTQAWPYTPWGTPCPQGYWCGGGSGDKNACPTGTYTPDKEGGAWSRTMCVWCAPGYDWTGRVGTSESAYSIGFWHDHTEDLLEGTDRVDETGEHTDYRLGWWYPHTSDRMLSRKSITQLQDLCRANALSSDGSKQDLIDRFLRSKRELWYQECVACPVNTFVNYPGNHSTFSTRGCTPCEKGKYSHEAATVCLSCTADLLHTKAYERTTYTHMHTYSLVKDQLKDSEVFDKFDCQCDPKCAEACSETTCYRVQHKAHSDALAACTLWGGEFVDYDADGRFFWAGEVVDYNHSTWMREGLELLNATTDFYFSLVEPEVDDLGRRWCALVHWNVSGGSQSYSSTLLTSPPSDDKAVTAKTDHYSTQEYVSNVPERVERRAEYAPLPTRHTRFQWHTLCHNPMLSICRKCNPGAATYGPACQRCDNTCPAGFYFNGCNQTFNGCRPCPPGFYSHALATTCTICSAGKYTPTSNHSMCLNCEAGKSSGAPEEGTGDIARDPSFSSSLQFGGGPSQCHACGPGYANSVAGGSCEECSSRVSPVGATACTVCAPGSHEPLSGVALKCTICTAGHYSATSSAAKCSPCEAGTFAAHGGMSACASCPSGSYGESSASTACTLCEAGTSGHGAPAMSSHIHRLACTTCESGKYSASTGATMCSDCERGKYSGGDGMSTCMNCSPGTFAAGQGASSCVKCKSGTFAASIKLASGHRSACANTCLVNCTVVLPASESERVMNSYCFDVDMCIMMCDAQYPPVISTTGGAFACMACPAGSYAPEDGAHACLSCTHDSYQASAGQAECTAKCPAGSAPGLTRTSCTICKEGTYSPAGASCLACAESSTMMYDSMSLLRPRDWSFANAVSNAECTCAPGYEASTQSLCTQCPAGKARPKSHIARGDESCDLCSYGHFPSELGAQCSSCTSIANNEVPRLMGPNHTYVYTNPGVDCSWRCAEGYYRWMPHVHHVYCMPCPSGTSSSVTEWHQKTEGRIWEREKELLQNDHLRPRDYFEWLEAQRRSLELFSTCSCNEGKRLSTLVKTDEHYLIKSHVKAVCSYPTGRQNASRELAEAESVLEVAKDKYEEQQAIQMMSGWTEPTDEAIVRELQSAKVAVIQRQQAMTAAHNLECCAVKCEIKHETTNRSSNSSGCPACWLPMGPPYAVPQCPPMIYKD